MKNAKVHAPKPSRKFLILKGRVDATSCTKGPKKTIGPIASLKKLIATECETSNREKKKTSMAFLAIVYIAKFLPGLIKITLWLLRFWDVIC